MNAFMILCAADRNRLLRRLPQLAVDEIGREPTHERDLVGLFGAICPAEGKGAGLVLPRCTTEGTPHPILLGHGFGREEGMARERSEMRRVKEVLRLRLAFGLSHSAIGAACRMPRTTLTLPSSGGSRVKGSVSAIEGRRMLPSASLATSSSPEHPANSEIEAVALRGSVRKSIVIGAILVGHRWQTTPSARSRRPLAGIALTAARR